MRRRGDTTNELIVKIGRNHVFRFSSEMPGIRSEVLMAVFSLVPSAEVAMPGISGFLKIHREREIPLRIVNPMERNG